MSLLRQIKFAEGLLLRVAVPREKDLQGKPAILSTRQHFHALPQQIQEKLQRAFFKCANRADDDPCRYFQWADKEPNKYTLSQNHTRPGYLAQKPESPSTPTPTKYKNKKELKFLPAVKRITSIILPPDEELVAPKRKKKNRRNSRQTRKSRKRFRHRSPCCKKGTTKIPVHRVRPKTFKASNSCLTPPLIKQLLKK